MQKMHLLMQIRSSKYTVYVLDTVVKSRQIQIEADELLVPWKERHSYKKIIHIYYFKPQ